MSTLSSLAVRSTTRAELRTQKNDSAYHPRLEVIMEPAAQMTAHFRAITGPAWKCMRCRETRARLRICSSIANFNGALI